MITSKLYKIKKKLLLIFIILIILFCGFLSFKFFYIKRNPLYIPTINSVTNSRLISEQALIKRINSVNKLITLELELSQVITIDQSYGDLDVLKKYKRIKFYSDCSYYIDLSKIVKDDLVFDEDLNTLNLTIPNPEIYNVSVDKDKIEEETSVNGLLRFGEIKLTTEEFKNLELEIISSLEEKLNNIPIFNEAKIKTKTSIENLVKDFISDDVNLNISFK
ncbi:DUF4230 domain-containing protein [Clostridium sp.]|uniref:DUF4230 domain-containing protein n=1 Tax=Clostridium sp. TaxID=1506 RepID=UPI002609FAE0|nr:DUF4230 domain-containing protein [Clostridium sp.]